MDTEFIFDTEIVISDDYKNNLLKSGINIEKWYHKLCTCQYFDENQNFDFNDEIIKNLIYEYQLALKSKNINALIIIKTELCENEDYWLKELLTGNIYNEKKVKVVDQCKSTIELSERYISETKPSHQCKNVKISVKDLINIC
jgi:hypothetical protein